MSRLRLPTARDPVVSLIVVVYGGYQLAHRTLAAIATAADVDYEVIVVDNASPDGAGSRLRGEVDGVQFVLSDRNLGFGTAANVGVLQARGRFVGLLNADIEPSAGFLSPLVAALDDDACAAAVTPLYLRPDGGVIEAGALLGVDGRGYGYGDRLPASHPDLGFRREVDYGSAAALLVRRDRFLQVGGFDPIFGLGYYEDADLCFALREAGFVTLYQPRSRVCHLEHGAFDLANRRRQLERNRPLFAQRYPAQLRGRPALRRPPFDPHGDLVVRDWWAPQRLLVIDPDGRLDAFASAVQAQWPRARVTTVGPTAAAGRRDGDPRVERHPLDRRLSRWLEQRRFHYGAVISTLAGAERYASILGATQPQALSGLVGAPAETLTGWLRVPDDPRTAMPRLGFPGPRR